MKTYSTQQAAKLAGIHWMTLHRWRAGGRVRASLSMPMNDRTLWRWTDRDVERVRKYKADHYRKGRGRKKGQKKSASR